MKQAGRGAGTQLTVEQLLAEAARGRSKFDAHANDIERMRAGGVTLRRIAEWLVAQGTKAEVGELGQWLKRREKRKAAARQVEQEEAQAGREEGGQAQAGAPAEARATALTVEPVATETPSTPINQVTGQPVRPAWKRSSDGDKSLDEKLEEVMKKASGLRGIGMRRKDSAG
jgi:hypothetical protein